MLITEASAVLYEATRHRSYIESVRILIPQTWENVTMANSSTWENFQVCNSLIQYSQSFVL
jgi:calcium-activated chloride channel regulator 4